MTQLWLCITSLFFSHLLHYCFMYHINYIDVLHQYMYNNNYLDVLHQFWHCITAEEIQHYVELLHQICRFITPYVTILHQLY